MRTDMKKPIIIAIVGPTCSGKTTLVYCLLQKFIGSTYLGLDDFYVDEDFVPKIMNRNNREIPESVDFDSYLNVLKRFKSGKKANSPSFSKITGKVTGRKTISPSPIVFTEGFLLLADNRLNNFFDIIIFLDAPEEVLKRRRIKREGELNIRYWNEVVMPNYYKHTYDKIEIADVVIDASKKPPEVLSSVVKFLDERLSVK
jgi:uridine kinase